MKNGSGGCRLALAARLAQALGQRQDGLQPRFGIPVDPHGGRLLAPFVERSLDLLGQHAGRRRVELDPGDAEAAAAELDAASAGKAELDPRLLQPQQVLGLGRERPEAVGQLVANRPQLARLAGGDDAAVDVDLGRLEGDVGGR